MKTRSILFSLLLLSLSLIGFAQETTTITTTTSSEDEKPKANIWFGPKFGLDLAHFTTDVNEVTGQLSSNYQAGLFCQIGKTLYLQPELYYSSYSIKSFQGQDSVKVNSIKCPIMVGLKFLDIGLVSLHLNGGPQFRFQLDDTDKITGAMQVDWQVGAGLDVLGFITADLRYTLVQGVSFAQQIDKIGTVPLNLTVGLKFR